jgi:hypothetical protein
MPSEAIEKFSPDKEIPNRRTMTKIPKKINTEKKYSAQEKINGILADKINELIDYETGVQKSIVELINLLEKSNLKLKRKKQ